MNTSKSSDDESAITHMQKVENDSTFDKPLIQKSSSIHDSDNQVFLDFDNEGGKLEGLTNNTGADKVDPNDFNIRPAQQTVLRSYSDHGGSQTNEPHIAVIQDEKLEP